MALKRDTRYPGRFVAASTAHPQGAFKNRSTPTAQDGSYLEADWMNDIDGFFARALNISGTTPNGNVDTGNGSQLFDAVVASVPGRLLNVQRFFGVGTYTPTTGTRKIIVEVWGAGGGGGATSTTTSTTVSIGRSGGGGAYSKGIYDVPTSPVPVVAGLGGTGGAAGNDNATKGGSSSFGTLIVCTGGDRGVGAGVQAVGIVTGTVAGGIATTPGNIVNIGGGIATQGTSTSTTGIVFSLPGSGPMTALGSNSVGNGGYAAWNGGSTAAQSGAAGINGLVIVWEYA